MKSKYAMHPCQTKVRRQSTDLWSTAEEQQLTAAVEGTSADSIRWVKLAKQLPGRTAGQCQAKWQELLKRDSNKGNWTEEEDGMLKKWVRSTNFEVAEHGPSQWTGCAQVISGRKGKQCRERWVNILDPCVKIGGWSDSEQARIFEFMKEYFTSWSRISKRLRGRTENSIKNYFYSTIRRIQSMDVFEYFMLMKEGKRLPSFKNVSYFEKEFELDKLNILGQAISRWLYFKEEAKKEHQTLFEYLLRAIAEQKKGSLIKRAKAALSDQSTSIEKSEDDEKTIQSDATEANLNVPRGVHPLLLQILNGDLDCRTFKMQNNTTTNFKLSLIPLQPESISMQIEKDALKRGELIALSNPKPQGREVPEATKGQLLELSPVTTTRAAIGQVIAILSQNATIHTKKSEGSLSQDNPGSLDRNTEYTSPAIHCGSTLGIEQTQDSMEELETRARSFSFMSSGSSLSINNKEEDSFDLYLKKNMSELEDTDNVQDTVQVCKNVQPTTILMCCKCMMGTSECSCI